MFLQANTAGYQTPPFAETLEWGVEPKVKGGRQGKRARIKAISVCNLRALSCASHEAYHAQPARLRGVISSERSGNSRPLPVATLQRERADFLSFSLRCPEGKRRNLEIRKGKKLTARHRREIPRIFRTETRRQLVRGIRLEGFDSQKCFSAESRRRERPGNFVVTERETAKSCR